jgi:hypothetical protein
MKKYFKLGYLLLAIWLIATGALELLGIRHSLITLALQILAVVTGVVILVEMGRMNWPERLGMIFLAIWLILVGLMPFVGMGLPFASEITIVLALLAGILLLVGMKGRKTAARIGMVLLAVWLIASAAISLLGLMIPASGVILAILAVISGILLLIGR